VVLEAQEQLVLDKQVVAVADTLALHLETQVALVVVAVVAAPITAMSAMVALVAYYFITKKEINNG
jgi:hypothetical protein